MGFARRNETDDATWARAWDADAVSDLVSISAIGGTAGPHHGDIALVDANGLYYLWMDDGSWRPLTPDYEEGSWTPVIGGSGGTTGQTYGLQNGRYVKVGSLVTCFFAVQLSAKGTITGNVEIQGLPFTISNDFGVFRSVCSLNWFDLATAQLIIQGGCIENTTVMFVRALAAAAVTMGNTLAAADINDDTAFSGTFIYIAQS